MTTTSEASVAKAHGVSGEPVATMLTQRLALVETIDDLLAQGAASQGALALISVNVRQYRDLLIELGHRGAETLIQVFAARLQECLRPVDEFRRLSDGDFVLVLPGLRNHAQPLMAVRRLQRACQDAFQVESRSLKLNPRFGIALTPGDAADGAALLICAETALRHAITLRMEVASYADLNRSDVMPVVDLEQSLRAAIENDTLDSVFQPIVDVNSGEFVSAEMLTRWRAPGMGAVSPNVFIDIAEKTGLITPLTFWAFNRGLRECTEWQTQFPGTSVAINLAPTVLCEPHLFEWISQALNIWDADPSRLTIEITEQSLMSDPKVALAVLHKLHERGVRIAIDDFGTGYSSLEYLKTLPVQYLKIDKSFVMRMLSNRADRQIVKSVIDLAHNFGLSVVAEGVEDEETLDSLTLMGCQRAQGFYISKPCGARELPGWLQTSPWRANA